MTDRAELAKQVEVAEAAIIKLVMQNMPMPTDQLHTAMAGIDGISDSAVGLATWELLGRGVIRFDDHSRRHLTLCANPKNLLLRDHLLVQMAAQFEPWLAVLVANTAADVLINEMGVPPSGELPIASSR